jgi:hypothetical protein
LPEAALTAGGTAVDLVGGAGDCAVGARQRWGCRSLVAVSGTSAALDPRVGSVV